MNIKQFDYQLPTNLIAQYPLENRSNSKLLVLNKNNNTIIHDKFNNIINYFNKGDILVRNNTKVLPVRLYGIKQETNAKIEVLLLKETNKDIWECLVGNAKKIKENTTIIFSDKLYAICIKVSNDGIRVLKMIYKDNFIEILNNIGVMPLPPYIKEKLKDNNKYQTVYAKYHGSSAAPTAGLHFTNDIFDKLKEKGVIIVDITLHVGLDTFKPLKVSNIKDHTMHSEYYQLDDINAKILQDAIDNNKRITTIGTTSTRTIESIYNKYNCFRQCCGTTNIFIYPGYKWLVTDRIITNFHLPKSTLIMMLASFTSTNMILDTYKIAITNNYRFFSFGDCMLVNNE